MSCTPKGCENLKENVLHTLIIWHPVGVQTFVPASTGGLRFATTTGYFLATLQVASLHFKLEFVFHSLRFTAHYSLIHETLATRRHLHDSIH
jgi:hypothetical protein